MKCNGKCQNHKVKKQKHGGRYEAGQKKCNSCNIFMEYEGDYFAHIVIQD